MCLRPLRSARLLSGSTDKSAEDLQDYHAALIHARNELVEKAPISAAEWPTELGDRPQQGAASKLDAHAVAKERADRDQDMHIEGLDVSMQVRQCKLELC